jgi:AraC-like DNA-binding protein
MTVPPLPKRSRLYSLDPMKVGTVEVESLTGYVARVAEAHCVTVSDLVGAELSDPASSAPLLTPYPGTNRANYFYTQSYSINGIAGAPRKWANILEAATMQQTLADLTLLAFEDLFSESRLLRKVSAWCPSCFESRRRSGARYESLLWAIGAVKICPLHKEPLREICPHCRRRLRPLAAHTRPGYCSRCGGWLGYVDAEASTEVELAESDLERETWIAKSIGDLLAVAPRLKGSPLRERLRTNLSACIESATSGNLLAFADLTRSNRDALRYWVSGAHRPQIGDLLRMCYHMRLPVIKLLGDPATADLDIAPLSNDRCISRRHREDEIQIALKRALAEDPPPSVSEVALQLGYVRTDRLYQIDRAQSELLAAKHRAATRALQPRPSRGPRRCERSEMKRTLENSVAREYPVSVPDIAKQYGYANPGCIRLEFPNLCRAIGKKIAQRRNAEMVGKGEILKAALSENPPPTAEQMAKRLGFASAGVLRRNFPALYQALLGQRKAHEEDLRKELHLGLISALAEDPAPTVPAVCERLGVSSSWVYFLHRDLAQAIAARRLQQRAELMGRRRELLRNEVFSIVQKLLGRGERPTQARVQAMLGGDSLRVWTTVSGFLHEAMRNPMALQRQPVH